MMRKTNAASRGESKEDAMWEGFLQDGSVGPWCFLVVLHMVYRWCDGFDQKPVEANMFTYIS